MGDLQDRPLNKTSVGLANESFMRLNTARKQYYFINWLPTRVAEIDLGFEDNDMKRQE